MGFTKCRVLSFAFGASLVVACSGVDDGEQGSKNVATSRRALTSSDAAEAEKRDYLANFVKPETIRHSFHAAEGVWVDCVDVHLQPSMSTSEMAGKDLATPPPIPAGFGDEGHPPGGQQARLDVELHADEVDENGDARHCDVGTVPTLRHTAAELARFATLRDFYRGMKGLGRTKSGGTGTFIQPSIKGFEYDAEIQRFANWGMQSFVSTWQPFVASTGSEHSLSQIWVATNYDSDTTLETAEAGWSVDWAWGNNQPHFFIYWTDDGYHRPGA